MYLATLTFSGVLLMLSRSKDDKHLWMKLSIDAVAILAQLSGALVWPIMQWTEQETEVS
jgi:hypothetical protein